MTRFVPITLVLLLAGCQSGPPEAVHVEECTAWIKGQIVRPETFHFVAASGAGGGTYRTTYVDFAAQDASGAATTCTASCAIRGDDHHFAGTGLLYDKPPVENVPSGACRLAKASG